MIRQASKTSVSRPAAVVGVALLAIGLTVSVADAASRRERPASPILQNTIEGPPVMAIVSLKDQRVSLYDSAGGALTARVSSGRPDYDTPVGIYSVLQKNEEHYSNVYDDASMPFMQRITWSGVALHAGELPGYPASHGCVRLPHSFAEQIFRLTKIGMRVIISRGDVAPVDIAHPLLFKPGAVAEAVATKTAYGSQDSDDKASNPFQPDVRSWPARQAQLDALKLVAAEKQAEIGAFSDRATALKRILATKSAQHAKIAKAMKAAQQGKKSADDNVARAERMLETATKPSVIQRWEEAEDRARTAVTAADAKLAAATAPFTASSDDLARATQDYNAAEAAKAAAENAAKDAERRTLPLSVFVSLKTQRLYVRQGHEPVFDVPVSIAEPDKPIGTFVYTAVDYIEQGNDLQWTAVSLNRRSANDVAAVSDRKSSRSDVESEPVPTNAAAAAAALDRITIPPDVLARLSGSVWPGSSLIVSDEASSRETGKATDFVVLISGEPQGGIKRRPKPKPPVFDNRFEYGDGEYYVYDRRGRTVRYRQRNNSFFSWW